MTQGVPAVEASFPDQVSGRQGLRVWVLTEGRAGDDSQLLHLAEALGESTTVLELRGNTNWHLVVDRFWDLLGLGRRPLRLPLDAPAEWPDLVLAIAGRSVSTARRIVKASGGETKAVHLGRPVANLNHFDLVVTTPQYGLPEHPGVLHTPLPFVPEVARPSLVPEGLPFAGLPRPWTAVLVGGDSGSYRIGTRSIERLQQAITDATRSGGSVLVTTSPRTSDRAIRALRGALPERAYFYEFQRNDPGNPYISILSLADRFVVTGESASLIAEAASTGRPVEILPVEERGVAKVLVRGHRWLKGSALGPVLNAMCARGLWMPPRDLAAVHRAAAAEGGARELDRIVRRVREVVAERKTARSAN